MGPVVDVVYQATISTGLRNPSCLTEDSGASSESGHNPGPGPTCDSAKRDSESAACRRGRLHSSLERACPINRYWILQREEVMSLNTFVKTFFSLVITLALIPVVPKPSASNRTPQSAPTVVFNALPLNFELN